MFQPIYMLKATGLVCYRNTTPLSSEIKSEAVPDYYIFIIHMNTSHTARQV